MKQGNSCDIGCLHVFNLAQLCLQNVSQLFLQTGEETSFNLTLCHTYLVTNLYYCLTFNLILCHTYLVHVLLTNLYFFLTFNLAYVMPTWFLVIRMG